jgi:hypothetical protein
MNDKLGIALGEASTWRGILVLLTLAGVQLAPEQTEAVIKAALALYGLFGVFFKRNPNSMPKK